MSMYSSMSSVLVTGANRGIGLGLVREFLSKPSVGVVIAAVRDVDSAKELKAIKSTKLHIVQLEIVNEESIVKAVKQVSEIVGEKGLDLLVNNAGMSYNVLLNGSISKAKVAEQFDVNTIAPLLISNKFYPLLKKAAAKKGSSQIANISSVLASLDNAANVGKEWKSAVYSMSKCSVNMLTRMLASEWKEDHIRATSFCPGWVKTDMGSQAAQLTVEEATVPLVKLMLSLTEAHNGQYYKTTGEKILW